MTDSAHSDHDSHSPAAHGHGHGAVAELKFEPSELDFFKSEDKIAGQVLGKLLAGIFMILLVLMIVAASWGLTHHTISDNPHDRPATAKSGH